MFCIFSFNKNFKDSLYHAYFASIHVAVSKQKVYRCCKNSLEKSEYHKIEIICASNTCIMPSSGFTLGLESILKFDNQNVGHKSNS